MKPISIFIFFVCFIFVNCAYCDSNYCKTDGFVCQNKVGTTCDSNCKPKYGDTTDCYDCSDITDNFYKITEGRCSGESSCVNGFIEPSKECIESTNINNLFHIDNVYYKECPDYSVKISSNECKCAYKYYKETPGSYHCLSPTEKCPSRYPYYDYETGECNDNCNTSGNTKYKKVEIGIIRCSSSCIGDEFYYGNSVPFTCTDYCDKLSYFDTDNKKRCSDNCPDNYKIKNNNCVHKVECQFYDNDDNNCLNSCEESSNKYHNFQSNECISNCNINTDTNNYLYLKDNICYPENKCNYIQDTTPNKKCLSTCNIEDGYIVPGLNTPSQCYTSCPPSIESNYKYHDHGENICMESCSESTNNKIYRKNGGFECFSSCKDIEDGTFIYEVQSGGEYICYDSIPTPGCNYYIRTNNGINKCLLDETYIPNEYKFLKGQELVKECDDYKAIDNVATTTPQLINCFLELNDCFTSYKYYNTNEKKCWKGLPFGYCIKSNVDSNKIEVIPVGDNYYYEDSSEKYCVNSCQAKNKYIDFNDKKKCISECSKTVGTQKTFYYYDPRNNECLETCIGSGLEFAEPATNSNASPCLISNDEKYYFENDKLLRDSCTLYKAPSSKICVPSCQPNEKINSNHECTNGCPSTAPYINDNNECKAINDDDCPFASEVGNKCISSCDSGEGFVIGSNKICYNVCPVGNQYHDSGSNRCITKCGESNDNKYHINGETVCYSSCDSIPEGPNGKYLYETKVDSSDT